MDGALYLFLDSEFELWREFRKSNNSFERSVELVSQILAGHPPLEESEWPLTRLLRGLNQANGAFQDIELELLATLGRMSLNAGIASDQYQKTKTFPPGLTTAIHTIHRIAQLSHRYWSLFDSQEQIRSDAAKAVRTKIAKAGGDGRTKKLDPLRRKVEKLALIGLSRSARQKNKYGRWSNHFDIWHDIHESLTDGEQEKVQPSTIRAWIRDAYPTLVSPNRKK